MSIHVPHRLHLTVVMVFVLVSAAQEPIPVALAVCSATQHVQIAQVLDPVIA